MMAYFKLVVNVNDDESFKRVVNMPARGIGDTFSECFGSYGPRQRVPPCSRRHIRTISPIMA